MGTCSSSIASEGSWRRRSSRASPDWTCCSRLRGPGCLYRTPPCRTPKRARVFDAENGFQDASTTKHEFQISSEFILDKDIQTPADLYARRELRVLPLQRGHLRLELRLRRLRALRGPGEKRRFAKFGICWHVAIPPHGSGEAPVSAVRSTRKMNMWKVFLPEGSVIRIRRRLRITVRIRNV